jgi:hypothetical protein
MKKIYIFSLCFCLLTIGCQTTKAVKKSLLSVGGGIIQDLKATWENIKEIDQWFRENCW